MFRRRCLVSYRLACRLCRFPCLGFWRRRCSKRFHRRVHTRCRRSESCDICGWWGTWFWLPTPGSLCYHVHIVGSYHRRSIGSCSVGKEQVGTCTAHIGRCCTLAWLYTTSPLSQPPGSLRCCEHRPCTYRERFCRRWCRSCCLLCIRLCSWRCTFCLRNVRLFYRTSRFRKVPTSHCSCRFVGQEHRSHRRWVGMSEFGWVCTGRSCCRGHKRVYLRLYIPRLWCIPHNPSRPRNEYPEGNPCPNRKCTGCLGYISWSGWCYFGSGCRSGK